MVRRAELPVDGQAEQVAVEARLRVQVAEAAELGSPTATVRLQADRPERDRALCKCSARRQQGAERPIARTQPGLEEAGVSDRSGDQSSPSRPRVESGPGAGDGQSCL